ncbi:aliphatic sulfonate ABC transporter substrate-binding protein [Pantoea vagans]|uniref:aliphatic sulfonate ABC transporter substrate-binding protein n=1 Tax=Pantoea vagans TaxID=470934 RepID=UPI0023AFECBE|nr:aliphatic sulfonate ABC transporter substrate-binding protein [Pantoea vagans]MDE8556686.1 aliphatic sulfonate ABC transporter substrate-binding protein [Pantoea vagans]MDE8576692.1 aliphatic sulfonate ABC transporter substrate-binding protein [Pantoea vagans]
MTRWIPRTAVAALILCAGMAMATEPLTLRIGFLRGPTDLALAKEKGTLEKALAAHQVNVVWSGPFAAAAPAYEALNAGSIDMTTGSSTAFVTAIAAGLPLRFFAYQAMPAEGEGIVVRNSSDIHSLQDLRGKKVAVNKGGTGEYLLSRALDRAGIPEQEVTKVYLSPSDTGTAFVGGHVDAWATWDPFLSLARQSYDARQLSTGQQIGSENAAGYFVSEAFYQAHPEVLNWVYDVLQQENHWAKAHPLEAGKIWASQIGQQGSTLAALLGKVNTVPVTPVDDAAITHIGHIADWYEQQGLIASHPDIRQHVVTLTP